MLVTDIDAPTGGLQKTSRHLLRELNRRGLKTYVCARNYHGLPRNEVQEGTLIHRSPVLSRSLAALNSLIYLIDALCWLVRHRKQYEVIHCQQMFGAATVGLFAKKLLGKPVTVGLHMSGSELGEVAHIHRMPLAKFRLRQLREVDRWVALSREMEGEVQTLGVLPEQVVVIPNGVVLPVETAFAPGVRERYRAALNLEKYKQVAVFTGRLSWEKGLDTLLEAWKMLQDRHPEAHLLLLGEGVPFRNVEPELRALREQLGLENVVHFLGHVSNVGEYLLASDIFILPTRSEGLSVALVEAMAAGTTIVTTDIPANRDIIETEVTGLLFPPNDARELAAALARVLDEPQLAERLRRNARTRAERDLSVEAMASRYLDAFSEVAA
jgi:glycosyltransferase involved in cell wall biosynthesis